MLSTNSNIISKNTRTYYQIVKTSRLNEYANSYIKQNSI